MKKYISNIYSLFLFLGIISTVNFAQAQVRPYRATDRQVITILTRIETNTDIYKQQVGNALRRGVLSGDDSETTFNEYVSEFETATNNLSQNFDARRSASADVEDLLNRANDINQFMQRNRLNAVAQRTWTTIRSDLTTLANYYSVSWNWNSNNNNNQNNGSTGNTGGTTRPYRVSDSNVQTLLTRIETRTDAYRREVNSALDRSVLNNTRSEDSLVAYINDFETATDKLRSNFNSRRSVSGDVDEVLNRAYYIDGFMRDYRLTTTAASQWRLLRTDLDTLSNYYNVSWNWNRQYSPTGTFDTRLTGTYRLNTYQSDNVADIVDRSTVNSTANTRDRQRTNLERRLSSPYTLTISVAVDYRRCLLVR